MLSLHVSVQVSFTLCTLSSKDYNDICYRYMMSQTASDWTEADTKICERAESSGLAINANTNKPLTINELKVLSSEYQKVMSNTSVDEFLKDKINSKPFDF